MRAPSRPVVVLAGVLLAGAALVASGRPWLRVDLTGMLTGTPSASVAGSDAAPVVPAVALVALAAAAAVSVAGPLGRRLAGLVTLLAGAGVVTGAAAVLLRPVPVASAALREATGGTPVPDGAVTVTGWPVVTVVAGLLLAGVAAIVLLVGRRWETGRRFEREQRGGRPEEELSDWDAITQGLDPTTRRDAEPDRG